MRIPLFKKQDMHQWHNRFLWLPIVVTDPSTQRKYWMFLEMVTVRLNGAVWEVQRLSGKMYHREVEYDI